MVCDRKLILENGTVVKGKSFGAVKEVLLELVFNTSMAGYQEIISDPSYTGQAVVMTYPLIGNYGISNDDYESANPSIGALIVREYNDEPSSFHADETLGDVMKRFDIAGISGVDTRYLTRIIREYGSCRVLITSADRDDAEALSYIRSTSLQKDQVSTVSAKKIRTAGDGKYHVVAVDCGMKENITRMLVKKGCTVTTVPFDTDAGSIEALCPDGIFISNGPGDPSDVKPVVNTIKSLKGKYPMFGICLGHQLISLSCGAKTYKLKFGHRGGNHPVKNLLTGRIEMTSQNHSYAVSKEGIEKTGLEITHINLLDETIEGIRSKKDRLIGIQYHPESAPGPCDSEYLFDTFIEMMNK